MKRVGALVLLGCWAWCGTAWSQTLEAQPATVDAPPWEKQAEVRIVLRNSGNDALLTPKLVSFTNDLFTVNIDPAAPATVNPGESVVWTARVTNLDQGRIPGSVLFDVSYRVRGKSGARRLYTALKVQASPTPEKTIDVTVQGSFDAISETRPGIGYLLATNSLDVPVNIRSVKVLQPDTRNFANPAVNPPNFIVAPRSSTTAAIALPTAKDVTPGKDTIVFDVEAEWDQSGHHYERRLMISKDVNVGIFFESEVLKAVGVPSFLLLPGCLFLLTMQLLLTLGLFGVNRHSRVPDVPVTSPGFWIVAVTFSGAFAWVYTYLTGKDYLLRYGARDLRNVWLSSIALGAIAYAIAAALTLRRRRQRVPSAKDSPVDTLLKMGRRDLRVYVNRVRFKMNNLDLTAFLIEDIEDGQTLVWVAPQIVATWSDAGAAAERFKVEELINGRKNALAIGEALVRSVVAENVDARWNAQGSVPNPYHLKIESITEYLPPDSIVRMV